MKKIIVAVTGASGSIYAKKLLETLSKIEELEEIAVVFSDFGVEVMKFEGERVPELDKRIVIYGFDDMFAPFASGSSNYDAMVIIPCSMGTLGKVANGVSNDLIGRAADIMLKERRKLIVVVRETPLNTIHLRNMTTLSECGAIIMPASPSFYSFPKTIDELCDTVIERITQLLGLDLPRYEWNYDNTTKQS